jgi:adenylosuccinate lyase
VKQHGRPNDLMDRIAADPAFGVTRAELEEDLRPELYVGRAPEQVDEFLEEWVAPALARYPEAAQDAAPELTVRGRAGRRARAHGVAKRWTELL